MQQLYSSSLLHPRHSGRLTAKHTTSYPALAFILLLVAVFLAGLTAVTQATDVLVTAQVAGTPPSQAAVITAPLNGSHFSTKPITVSGTCPRAMAVEIFDNNVFRGSTLCDISGSFSLSIDLFNGANQLQAKVFNFGNSAGPPSKIVTVYYASGQTETGQALTLQTSLFYEGYRVGEEVEWQINISGGVAPYAIDVDWGDNTSTLETITGAGLFTIDHSYNHPGGYHGNYPIIIKAADSSDQTAYLQLFVLVNNPNAVNSGATISSNIPPNSLRFAWLAFLIAVLMAISFYLGEKREKTLLLKP